MIPRALRQLAGDSASGAPVVVEGGSPGHVRVESTDLINMASNDYLGLARHPRVVAAAGDAIRRWGLGTASTRPLSGTTGLHRRLEQRLADWSGTDDAVLFGSCWTANAAVFEMLAELSNRVGATLAVFSDQLNHASIIDAIRAQRATLSHLSRYERGSEASLRDGLAGQPATAVKVIVTDGVFSMEGDQADLATLVKLADEHDALLVVDDSHGLGVVGTTGRGTAEAQGVLCSVDVVTGTLGKALGGASGGFVATTSDLSAWLRTGSRPFVFSNNPSVPVVAGALAALDILSDDSEPLATLRSRTDQLRRGVAGLGLPSVSGDHPIVPVIIGDDDAAREVSRSLRRLGVFATALTFPIVARGAARLRLQASAAHTVEDIDRVLDALDRACAQRGMLPARARNSAPADASSRFDDGSGS